MSRTIPSFAEEGLKRFLHGMDRRIKDLERGGDWRFDTELDPDEVILAGSAAQLLCMSAASDSIASGGDYVTFGAILAQYGFSGVSVAGSSWTHPVGGVYVLTYEHAWDSYAGGGTIELELGGVVTADATIAASATGQAGSGTMAYVAAAGSVGKIKVTQSSGLAQTCTATVRVAVTDPAAAGQWTLLETVWLETRNNTSATSTSTLLTGDPYRFVIAGNYDGNTNVADGAGVAVIYPSTVASNDAGADAERNMVDGHSTKFTINLGSGAAHVEPEGGPYSTAQPGSEYVYLVTGKGSAVTFAHGDSPTDDNNGRFRIDIYRRGT